MNRQNQQYFETKEEHKKSFHKKAWIIWLIILMIGIAWIFNEISFQIDKPLSEKQIINKTKEFLYAKSDQNFISEGKDFQILIIKGLYYGEISQEMPLMIISKDTTETLLYVKKTTTDKNYTSLIKQWKNKITKTDSTYKFFDIIDQSTPELRKESGRIELSKNGKKYVGKIIICQRNQDIYIVQGISNEQSWNTIESDISEMIDKFEIK